MSVDAATGGPRIPKNAYVRQFWSKCRSLEVLGTVASSLRGIHPGLYRVSVGAEPRAILWHDDDAGVVWLCAGLSAPDGDPRHEKLYAEVERRLRHDLLPSHAEQEAARAERFWYGVIDELAYALRRAHQEPLQWFDAPVATTTGDTIRYARFMAEEEQVPGEGTMLARYFVVLRQPPSEIPHPPYWQKVMIAELFPEGGKLLPVYADEIPPGADLRPEDVIFLHEVEVYDEEEDV